MLKFLYDDNEMSLKLGNVTKEMPIFNFVSVLPIAHLDKTTKRLNCCNMYVFVDNQKK